MAYLISWIIHSILIVLSKATNSLNEICIPFLQYLCTRGTVTVKELVIRQSTATLWHMGALR